MKQNYLRPDNTENLKKKQGRYDASYFLKAAPSESEFIAKIGH